MLLCRCFLFCMATRQDQDSLLVKRRNDNHSPGHLYVISRLHLDLNRSYYSSCQPLYISLFVLLVWCQIDCAERVWLLQGCLYHIHKEGTCNIQICSIGYLYSTNIRNKVNKNHQGVPQSQPVANSDTKRKRRRTKIKAFRINKQMLEKHIDQLSRSLTQAR